jgi:hypothetical protein
VQESEGEETSASVFCCACAKIVMTTSDVHHMISNRFLWEQLDNSKTYRSLKHKIEIHIEGPFTSEALKFLSSRMSHYACWPPFS